MASQSLDEQARGTYQPSWRPTVHLSSRRKVIALAAIALAVTSAGVGFADDSATTSSPPTPQMREKMAALHEKMAQCLRSTRPFDECRNQMRQQCHEHLEERNCAMMNMEHGQMGMHSGSMHQPPAKKAQQPEESSR